MRNHFSVFGKSLHTLSSKGIISQKVRKDIGVMRVYTLSVLRSAGVMEQIISLLRFFKAVFGKFVVDGNGVLSVKAGKTEIFPGDFRRLYKVIDI